MAEQFPKVGAGVLIFKDGKILLGKRKNAHGAGKYSSPGGHVEFGETFEEAVRRETMEEAGIEIDNVRVIALSTLLWPNKHYADIGVVADWKSGEPKVLEPEKCEGWDWYDPEHLPGKTFASTEFYLEALKTGQFYFGTKKFTE